MFDEKCEIRTTETTWMLKYDGECEKDIIEKIMEDCNLVYLEINKTIFRNEFMEEKINNVLIKYNPLSFRQSDDSIKYKIYEILKEYGKFKHIYCQNLYFIGGEMVFYSKLFQNLNQVYMITDYETIYEDAKRNSAKYDKIFMIDYDKDELIRPESIDNFTLIANTSKQGLGKKLSEEIVKLGIQTVFIISCNQKSFYKDFEILKKKYVINKTFEIKTNYIVTIYLLKIKIEI